MRHKAADRSALLRDSDYFAGELTRRLERLEKIEPDGRARSDLQQASAVVRRVRGLARVLLDEQQRRLKLERRAA